MHIVSVKLFDYRLTETNLEALASEFCGKTLADLNVSTGKIDIEFEDEEAKNGFLSALSCFKIDFGDKK